tara:strand:- start:3071 stop:3229 length:159 start_codon:yes stop_codon:yes gene_type:complete
MFKRLLTLWYIADKINKIEKDLKVMNDKVEVIDAWFNQVEQISMEYKKTFGN